MIALILQETSAEGHMRSGDCLIHKSSCFLIACRRVLAIRVGTFVQQLKCFVCHLILHHRQAAACWYLLWNEGMVPSHLVAIL